MVALMLFILKICAFHVFVFGVVLAIGAVTRGAGFLILLVDMMLGVADGDWGVGAWGLEGWGQANDVPCPCYASDICFHICNQK